MIQYFALIGKDDRRGPFESLCKPVELLKEISEALGHSKEEARNFFLHGSAVEKVEVIDGKTDRINVGWLAREEACKDDEATGAELEKSSHEELARKKESELREAHFTLAARKAAEVNEGGLVEAKTI